MIRPRWVLLEDDTELAVWRQGGVGCIPKLAKWCDASYLSALKGRTTHDGYMSM